MLWKVKRWNWRSDSLFLLALSIFFFRVYVRCTQHSFKLKRTVCVLVFFFPFIFMMATICALYLYHKFYFLSRRDFYTRKNIERNKFWFEETQSFIYILHHWTKKKNTHKKKRNERQRSGDGGGKWRKKWRTKKKLKRKNKICL